MNIREEFSAGIQNTRDSLYDAYTMDLVPGPWPFDGDQNVKWLVDKVSDRLQPENKVWMDDENIGAETVSMFGASDPALGVENFKTMFDRVDGNMFDGIVQEGNKQKRIFAPFSTYMPSALWPWQRSDGGRYTVHDFAEKDLPLSKDLSKTVAMIVQEDLDIDEDGVADWGGLPMFRFWGDPLLGLPPTALIAGLIFGAAVTFPSWGPIVARKALPI